MPPKQRKIAIMGFRSVGKSSITIQFVEKIFVDSYEPTIENTFIHTLKHKGQEYSLQVIDTAGQDEYTILNESHFLTVNGFILVFSVTSKKSFDVVKVIYDKVIDRLGNSNQPIVLIGNKNDLTLERSVSRAEAEDLAKSWKVPYLETCAKDYQSVYTIFTRIIEAIEKLDSNEPQKSCIMS